MKCQKGMVEQWQEGQLMMGNSGVRCGGMQSDRL